MSVAGAGRGDAGVEGASERRGPGLAGLLLLVAVAAGLLAQGAYYPPAQRYLLVLLAAAAGLALGAWPLTRAEIRLPPVAPALALAAWAVLDGALHGVAGLAVRPALLILGAVATLLVCRRLGEEDRQVLLLGVVGVGLVVAAAGWLGGAGRVGSWAFQAQGLWRGALGLGVGRRVLGGRLGPRATARAAAGPLGGALLALACLLPSMPAASPPRPALALAGLGGGLALAVLLARLRWRPVVALLAGCVLAGGLAALLAG